MATTQGKADHDDGAIKVKTRLPSLPLPRNEDRAEIVTTRLIMRPLTLEDVEVVHVLRTQPEVMAWTRQGRPDANLGETKAAIERFTTPNEGTTYNFAIFWRDTGELVGLGGSHIRESELGWPEFGYMLRKEFWGRGLAGEFVEGFLRAYSELPRSLVELRVHASSVVPIEAKGGSEAEELILAMVESSNVRSHAVLRKSGLERLTAITQEVAGEKDSDGSKTTMELSVYGHFPGRAL